MVTDKDSIPPQPPTQTQGPGSSAQPGSSRPPWVEVVLRAPAPQAEAAADFLVNFTGQGVVLRDPLQPGGPVEVVGYLEPGSAAAQQAALRQWAARLGEGLPPGAVELELDFLSPQDWSEDWKQHFAPHQPVPGLWVAPPWESDFSAQQPVLFIDPGQAFGTGQHESTRLCLQWLVRRATKGPLPGPVLDLGSGSGILALVALLLGAPGALALDIDAIARQATWDNARLNKLEDRLEVSGQPLDQLPGRFPVILANLTTKDLVELAAPLAARLEPGGTLVMSGILLDQADQVRAALEARGLHFLERLSLGEWAALVMS